jgi:hypothetical protein
MAATAFPQESGGITGQQECVRFYNAPEPFLETDTKKSLGNVSYRTIINIPFHYCFSEYVENVACFQTICIFIDMDANKTAFFRYFLTLS